MADAPAAAEGAPAAPGPSKLPMILALVNLLAVLAAAGTLVYTRVLFKRPAITEDGERERLMSLISKPKPPDVPVLVKFDPVTVNIESNTPPQPGEDGTPPPFAGKSHYVLIAFALEARDQRYQEKIEDIRDKILDRLLQILGHKKFHELTSVQGRYVLRTEILNAVNGMLLDPASAEGAAQLEHVTQDAIVTNAYFTQFIVQ